MASIKEENDDIELGDNDLDKENENRNKTMLEKKISSDSSHIKIMSKGYKRKKSMLY